MEPGRFLVAQAGVLLAKVTQLKSKGSKKFVGVDTGMHTLLRPSLYGAYHPIHNLSRLEEPDQIRADIVGSICESGDILGKNRDLPQTEEGDVILIENVGAYTTVMASPYNLRKQPGEEWID